MIVVKIEGSSTNNGIVTEFNFDEEKDSFVSEVSPIEVEFTSIVEV